MDGTSTEKWNHSALYPDNQKGNHQFYKRHHGNYNLTLDALELFTEYRFEVVAVTDAGSGMAAMMNATTDQDGTYIR